MWTNRKHRENNTNEGFLPEKEEAPETAIPKRRGRPKKSVPIGQDNPLPSVTHTLGQEATPAAHAGRAERSLRLYDTNRVKGSHSPATEPSMSHTFSPKRCAIQMRPSANKRVRKETEWIRTDDPESLSDREEAKLARVANLLPEDQDAWTGQNPACAVCDCIPHTHEMEEPSDPQIYVVHNPVPGTPYWNKEMRTTCPESIRHECVRMDGRDRRVREDDPTQHLERLQKQGESRNSELTRAVYRVNGTMSEFENPDEEIFSKGFLPPAEGPQNQ